MSLLNISQGMRIVIYISRRFGGLKVLFVIIVAIERTGMVAKVCMNVTNVGANALSLPGLCSKTIKSLCCNGLVQCGTLQETNTEQML